MCSNSETAEEAAREGLKIAQEARLGDADIPLPCHCSLYLFFKKYLVIFFFCPGHFSCGRLLFCCLFKRCLHLRKKHLEVGDKSLEASMLCISSEVNMVPRPGLMDQCVDGFDGLTVDVLYGPSVVWHLFPLLFFWGGGGVGGRLMISMHGCWLSRVRNSDSG